MMGFIIVVYLLRVPSGIEREGTWTIVYSAAIYLITRVEGTDTYKGDI